MHLRHDVSETDIEAGIKAIQELRKDRLLKQSEIDLLLALYRIKAKIDADIRTEMRKKQEKFKH
ncbi:hypothetical protein JCM19236_5851 [Vibrio sp. JCM 19236]|nr:hypothetical protein JCM19236_5851 [Vibrio sp. JCM 19236]